MTSSVVIDCSALVVALTDTGSTGEALRARLRGVVTPTAPTLLDYELISALLGLERGGKLTGAQVAKAISDYKLAGIIHHETLPLWERVRKLRSNLSSYDAQYVALAEVLGVPLVTCDARVKRSGVARCAVEVFD